MTANSGHSRRLAKRASPLRSESRRPPRRLRASRSSAAKKFLWWRIDHPTPQKQYRFAAILPAMSPMPRVEFQTTLPHRKVPNLNAKPDTSTTPPAARRRTCLNCAAPLSTVLPAVRPNIAARHQEHRTPRTRVATDASGWRPTFRRSIARLVPQPGQNMSSRGVERPHRCPRRAGVRASLPHGPRLA
jgi:hypothetical protein